jgi:CheY-like chemotaxis protein
MNDQMSGVMLIDDDEVDVMSVKRAFKQLNITNPLYVAGNGLEALAMLRGENGLPAIPRPLIILVDLYMPRMNGIEFLEALRADPILGSLTVVVLTTSNQDRDKVDGFMLNVAGYIVKPVTPARFVEAMATLDKYWTLSEIV